MSRPVRHFLRLSDWKTSELEALLAAARTLKRAPIPRHQPLRGTVLGLMFQKPSMRTRVSFEVGMAHLGGAALYFGPQDFQLGVREPAKDVARVLSRYVDGIVARTFAHKDVEELARYATIPVINGLSDLTHPCQVLGDLLTIEEKLGHLRGVHVAYVGDGNNVLHALLEGCALMGMHLSYATPKGYEPQSAILMLAKRLAVRSQAIVQGTHDPQEAVAGADVVYTDVWTSMGQEAEAKRRRLAFRGFMVTLSLMRRASRKAIVMHCLPAHRGEEIADAVIESRQSVIFDQAENRLHAQKALLLKLLRGA